MGHARRRISYVIPAAPEPVPSLKLPTEGTSRLGAVRPLLTYHEKNTESKRHKRPKQPRHRLGVSCLALDTSTQLVGRGSPEGILYSGGRDGLILSWDLGVLMKRRELAKVDSQRRDAGRWEILAGLGDCETDKDTEKEKLPADDDVLGDVSVSRKNLPRHSISYERQWETDLKAFQSRRPAEFRQSTQANLDWINDIALCNFNQTVISASSDGTVKSWSPHLVNPLDPSTIGHHSDYVRSLAPCRESNWVASGSFDRTIKLWDLTRTDQHDPLMTMTPSDSNATKASIYALAADPFGTMIASGSPERVIRLWDPRMGRRTGKFVGHTDNIRSILISEDSKYLLTGSADASIKLWSLASQRCLHTFTHHMESVWSLHSTHPSLEIFYSGDRSGLVCRVDVENCTDVSEGECIVLCHDTDPSNSATDGINNLVVMDDNLIWTASGRSDIKRWSIPQRRSVRVESLTHLDGDRLYESDSSLLFSPKKDLLSSNDACLSSPHSSLKRTDQILTNLEATTAKLRGIPLDSLVRLLAPRHGFTPHHSGWRGPDMEAESLCSTASIKSIPRIHASKLTCAQHIYAKTILGDSISPCADEGTSTVNVTSAIPNYEEREVARDAIPLRVDPDEVLFGENGLIRVVILNDRMHALTTDTSGEVAVWDIAHAVCLGRFLHKEISTACEIAKVKQTPRELLEIVRQRIEGEVVISSWASADTKAGLLTIHLTERSFESDVYADDVGYQSDKRFNDESKINLGKWVLRNLFSDFIREERRARREQKDDSSVEVPPVPPSPVQLPLRLDSQGSPSGSHHSTGSRRRSAIAAPRTSICQSPKMIPCVPPSISPRSHASPLLSPVIPFRLNHAGEHVANHKRSRSATLDGVGETTAVTQQFTSGSTPSIVDEGPISNGNGSGGLMGRLRQLGRSRRPASEAAITTNSAISSAESPITTTESVTSMGKTAVDKLLSGPLSPVPSSEAPSYSLHPNIILLISEEASTNYRTVYRGTIGSVKYDVQALEKAMPLWLLEFLLLNKLSCPLPPSLKLSFILLPSTNSNQEDELPSLVDPTQSKLTAGRQIRVKKLLQHVQEKLDNVPPPPSTPNSRTSSRSSQDQHPKAEDVYEILCNDVLLPLGMTLAAVKQYVWRQNTDLTMCYRRKVAPKENP